MNAPVLTKSKVISFNDGDETIRVRLIETVNGEYAAFDAENIDSPMGWGLTEMSAIADLFAKLPRAASDREERDDLAAKWDHARALRQEAV